MKNILLYLSVFLISTSIPSIVIYYLIDKPNLFTVHFGLGGLFFILYGFVENTFPDELNSENS